jgi:uncharacterized protein (DUF1501 family)
MTHPTSRRQFLKQGGALASAAGVGMPLVMNLMATGSAQAAAATGYKALVCVFLAGGNDAFNTVIRTDSVEGNKRFMSARKTVGLDVMSVANGVYTPLSPVDLITKMVPNKTGINSLTLALHPALVKTKARLEAGKLAVIGNIGPLADVTNSQTYAEASVAIPPKLFSHNDQTSTWQSGQPEGAVSGWGAELVRRFPANNLISDARSHMFSAVAIETSPVFCSGGNLDMPDALPVVTPFGAASNGGALKVCGYRGSGLINDRFDRDTLLAPIFSGNVGRGETTAKAAAGNLIEEAYLAKLNAANNAWSAMSTALAQSSADGNLSGEPALPADNGLAAQLRMVAKMIKASSSNPLALGRQVFFVQIGGFDTHSGQVQPNSTELSTHGNLLRKLDDALQYFDDMLGTGGQDDRSKVVTFTASEFGRKLDGNGDGTDHGWGGHHFVMGGAVKGGVYGYFPDLGTWTNGAIPPYGDPQMLRDGTLVPSVSVDLFAKELGQWLGIDWASGSNVQLGAKLFPRLKPSTPVLGFLA